MVQTGRVLDILTLEVTRRLDGQQGVCGKIAFDIYLNARACWRDVPTNVWTYKLGGYQVLKKWLSYRERRKLHLPLKPEEVQHFADTARRIAAMRLVSTSLTN